MTDQFEVQPVQQNFNFVTSPQPDVAAALNMWRELNADGKHWASLWAVQFDTYRIVRVELGRVSSFTGQREACIQTVSFYLNPDGTVSESRQTHS